MKPFITTLIAVGIVVGALVWMFRSGSKSKLYAGGHDQVLLELCLEPAR